jgi:hypothetical protein
LTILVLNPGVVFATPPIRGIVVLAGVLLGMVAMAAAAFGLATGRRWAVAATTPMLLLLVFAGTFELVWALTHGSITVPIGGVLALWALRAPLQARSEADGPPGRRLGVPGALAVGATAMSVAWPIASAFLLGAGGPFLVGREDLLPSLNVTCDSSPGRAPTSIQVAYDWRWSRAEPWAAGDDTVTIEAATQRDDGLGGYVLESDATMSAGIWQSNITIGNVSGITFGIDLAAARFEPGSVRLGFLPPGDLPTGHGSVEVRATYLHAPAGTDSSSSPAVWKVVSPARCEW